MPVGLVGAQIIAGIAGGAGAAGAAAIGASASKKATKASSAANAAALALEQQNEAQRKREWEMTEAENRRQWDIAQALDERAYYLNRSDAQRAEQRGVSQWNAEQTRRQPYRDVSLAAVQSLAKQAGLTAIPTSAFQLPDVPPAEGPLTLAELAKYNPDWGKPPAVPSASAGRT